MTQHGALWHNFTHHLILWSLTMANALYPSFKALLLVGGVNLATADIKIVLVDLADYTYGAGHDFLDDVPVAARVDISGSLTTKTTTGGVFDSDNPVFSAAAGDVSEAIIMFVDSGAAATSNLIAYYDTGVTGLPVTPNSGDINVTVDGAGWFAL